MEDIRAYLLSVTAAAILCGIVNTLLGEKGVTSAVARLLSGILLSIAVLQPLSGLAIGNLQAYLESVNLNGADVAAMGTEFSQDAIRERIKEETEAYILDKAVKLSLDIAVEVTLSSDSTPVPVAVTLSGAASPYAKSTLQAMIAEALGIPKEAQTWM